MEFLGMLTCHAHSTCQHVFEYFTERTPRSHLELRDTSLVWNYKYAGTGETYHSFSLAYFSVVLNVQLPFPFFFSSYYDCRC